MLSHTCHNKKYCCSSGLCLLQIAIANAIANKPQSQSFGCFCKLAYSSVISLSLVLRREAICSFVESGSELCRLSYTLTVGLWVPTGLTVTQWLPPDRRIWTDSSQATLKLRFCPKRGFCNEPTGSETLSALMSCWAAWISLSFSHLPLSSMHCLLQSMWYAQPSASSYPLQLPPLLHAAFDACFHFLLFLMEAFCYSCQHLYPVVWLETECECIVQSIIYIFQPSFL